MAKNKSMINSYSENIWNSRYESGQTGWDIGKVSRPIREYIDQLTDMSISILIPGCGNAYEAEYLSTEGFMNITLIDISDVLIKRLERKFAGNESINLLNKDFFEHEGTYDLIIEHTFFCSINPSMRGKYADKMISLLSAKGKLAGVLFDREFGHEGPPFGGSKEEYRKLFSENFKIKVLEKCRNSIAPRSGSEVFLNLKPMQ
jgi:hypothetical protein